MIARDRDDQKAEMEEIDVDGHLNATQGHLDRHSDGHSGDASGSNNSSDSPITHSKTPITIDPLLPNPDDDGDRDIGIYQDPVLSDVDDRDDDKSDEHSLDGHRPTRAGPLKASPRTRVKSRSHGGGRRYCIT